MHKGGVKSKEFHHSEPRMEKNSRRTKQEKKTYYYVLKTHDLVLPQYDLRM